MPFWSSQTLKARIPTDQLVVPYEHNRVVHAAYEMRVGPEAFVTSGTSETTELAEGSKIVIPPGQFGLLVTQETVRIPANVIAFISIRAGIKFRGLINVSGFHVDPGYRGQLRFAVYNAGSQTNRPGPGPTHLYDLVRRPRRNRHRPVSGATGQPLRDHGRPRFQDSRGCGLTGRAGRSSSTS